MNVLRFPVARITVCFIPGIVCATFLKPDPELLLILLLSSFALLLIAFSLFKNFKKTIYLGILLYLTSFLAGVSARIVNTEYLSSSHYVHQITKGENYLLEVTLREKLKNNSFGQKYTALVRSINKKPCSGKVLVNLKTGNGFPKLCVGTNLLIQAKVIKHRPPLNPDQFDYGKYLDNKSIPAQVYVDQSGIRIISGIDKDIWYYSDLLRKKILNNLKESGFREAELNVLNALILGQQQEVAPETLRDYQYAGAVHILSVSGLHVGFLLLFLNFLMKALPKNKFGNAFKLLLIVVFLWSFAIIAGLSPSVVRSVTMFSFLACGMYLKRCTNIFHTLLVSILLILLFEPSFIFDVGFQLSYTALFFILWLQPLLSALWNPRNKILQYFWDILTVSFAAQIGAFPLSIYYFHQFPGLFFITNLVIIPFLSVIMILGVVVMLLAAFGYVPLFPAVALEWSIYLINRIINRIAAFEGFVIQDIPFSFIFLLTTYFLIIAVIIWLKNPQYRSLIFALCSIIAFQTGLLYTRWDKLRENELIVFSVKNNSIIAERHGDQVTIYRNLKGEDWKERTLQPYLIANFCEVKTTITLKNTLFFNKTKILVIDSAAVFPIGNPDLVILTQSPKINLQRLLKDHKPAIIVADVSNYKTYVARWEATCKKEKIPFHYTGEKGFFRLRK